MDFLPEEAFWRRSAAARRARMRELVSLGIPTATAKAQATAEFAMYDRIEVDARGWIRLGDLELPELTPKPPR